jgi:hypothetical protein
MSEHLPPPFLATPIDNEVARKVAETVRTHNSNPLLLTPYEADLVHRVLQYFAGSDDEWLNTNQAENLEILRIAKRLREARK